MPPNSIEGVAKLGNLPAIFLIGEAGTTKTSTMMHSGLEPELIAGQVYQDTNVVPTRLANVWFARRSIFVEAGGKLLGDAAAWQRLVRRLPVGESVVEAILNLVRSARPGRESGEIGKLISWGPSPRASQALMLVARARALIDGRLSPSIDDVMAMAEPILKHRMALTFAARADGETVEGVIGKLKARIG